MRKYLALLFILFSIIPAAAQTGDVSNPGCPTIGCTFTGQVVTGGNGAASVAPLLLNGTMFSSGSATTNFPALFIQPTGTAAVTSWSASGTVIGINAVSGFVGNFIDFHLAGGGSLFKVDSTGNLTIGNNLTVGASVAVVATGSLAWSGRGAVTSPASGSIQLGNADSATPSAQTLRAQSGAGTNIAATNTTMVGSLASGNASSGDLIFQTGGAVAGSGSTTATATTALTIKGVTGLIQLPLISSDATHTDSSICQDTTTHALYSGSGTLGVCLGTSSARYKQDVVPQHDGLAQIAALDPVNYRYIRGRGDNGAREQYGFLAEDVVNVLPKLVALDAEGKPNSVDILGMVPVIVRALKELKVDNEELRAMIRRGHDD